MKEPTVNSDDWRFYTTAPDGTPVYRRCAWEPTRAERRKLNVILYAREKIVAEVNKLEAGGLIDPELAARLRADANQAVSDSQFACQAADVEL